MHKLTSLLLVVSRPWFNLRRDRRGVTAIMVAMSATVLFGMAALATETGSWYFMRRNVQSAADNAAAVGAMRLSMYSSYVPAQSLTTSQSFAVAAARDALTRNNFVDGQNGVSVTIASPPANGSLAADEDSVEVRVVVTQPRTLSALFPSLGANQTITGTAVAQVQSNNPACLLGLGISGQASAVTVNAGATLTVNSCNVAANATGPSAIADSGTISAPFTISAGGCTGCTDPFLTYQAAATNPFSYMDSATYTAPAVSGCRAANTFPASGNLPVNPTYCSNTTNTGGTANINHSTGAITTASGTTSFTFSKVNLNMTGGSITLCAANTVCTINFVDARFALSNAAIFTCAGTCVMQFFNSSFTTANTSRINCNASSGGCSMIFAQGSGTTGAPSWRSSGQVLLNAPTGGTYPGIAIYVDKNFSDAGCAASRMNITGTTATTSATTNIAGIVYAPTACMRFGAVGPTGTTANCIALVAGQIIVSASSTLNFNSCTNFTANYTSWNRYLRGDPGVFGGNNGSYNGNRNTRGRGRGFSDPLNGTIEVAVMRPQSRIVRVRE